MKKVSLLLCSLLSFTFTHFYANAQSSITTWSPINNLEPFKINDPNNLRVGIGNFNNGAVQAFRLTHLYAQGVAWPGAMPFMRIHDATENYESGIEFCLGAMTPFPSNAPQINNRLSTGQDWMPGMIKSVLLPGTGPGLYPPTAIGGIALFAQMPGTRGQYVYNGHQDNAQTEILRVINNGTGILQTNPLEALHIWKRMTFHVGSEEDYIGYNVTTMAGNILQRFDKPEGLDTATRPNVPAIKIGFGRDGVMRLGNAGTGPGNSKINFMEKFGEFKGMVIGNTTGWGPGAGVVTDPMDSLFNTDRSTVAIGMYWPDPNSRLAIRSIGNTDVTNALHISNTNSWGPASILTLKDDGNLGLKNSTPTSHLTIGTSFNFTDFPTSSHISHNAYYRWDNNTNTGAWKRNLPSVYNPSTPWTNNIPAKIEAGSGIIQLEIGSLDPTPVVPNSEIPDWDWQKANGLFIRKNIDKYDNGNWLLLPEEEQYVNVGVGERYPDAKLTVKGSTNTSAILGVNVKNSDNSPLLVIKNNGASGFGTSSPVGKLDINVGTTLSDRADYPKISFGTKLNAADPSLTFFKSAENGCNIYDRTVSYPWTMSVSNVSETEDIMKGAFVLTTNSSAVCPDESYGNSVSAITVLRNGSVGIGCTPNAANGATAPKLAVQGIITAIEVKVKIDPANYPDYVFSPDYKLQSLEEVAEHIEQQGHLPGIPTATATGKDGMNVGEMQIKLLEKIEELTLHLIRINKENAEMKEQLKKLLQENK